jgi:hypothetical protein
MERMDLDMLMIRLHACMAAGRYVESRRLLEQVLQEEPAHGVAHGMMGWIMWALVNDHERALMHFRNAVRWAPGDVNTWMHYLNLLVASGLGDELHAAYGNALQVPGIDRAQVHAAVARFLERSGRRAEAAELYGRAAAEALSTAEERTFREARLRLRGGGLRKRLANVMGLL